MNAAIDAPLLAAVVAFIVALTAYVQAATNRFAVEKLTSTAARHEFQLNGVLDARIATVVQEQLKAAYPGPERRRT